MIPLTIGMIVKNESANLAKCLDSLAPLLKAVESELIAVDTGSSDDTIKILKDYTKNVRFFEWRGDFSAARNASLEDAKGEWFMFIDADEFFGDCSDLIVFFKSGEYKKYNSATYIVRNYSSFDDDSDYTDFNAARLTKILPETKFVKPIHEYLNTFGNPVKPLKSFVRHYGYAGADAGKNERYAGALLKELENNPDDYMLYIQLANAYFASDSEKALEFCARGLEKAKKTGNYAPFMFYAVMVSAHFSKGNYEKALEVSEEYFSERKRTKKIPEAVIGTDMEICALKGMSLSALGRRGEAIAPLKSHIKLYDEYDAGKHHTPDTMLYSMQCTNRSNFIRANLTLGECLLASGEYDEAGEFLKYIPDPGEVTEGDATAFSRKLYYLFYVKKDASKIAELILKAKTVPPSVHDALYFILAARVPAKSACFRISEESLEGFCSNTMFARALVGEFMEYVKVAQKGGLPEDIRAARWISALAVRLIGMAKTDADILSLFGIHTIAANAYLSALYRPEVFSEDNIENIPAPHRAGRHSCMAAEAFKNKNNVDCLYHIKIAASYEPDLNPVIGAQVSLFKTLDSIAVKIKDEIRSHISRGSALMALRTLEAYRELNPSDKEIPDLIYLIKKIGENHGIRS